jgi:hypothetical protein
MRSIHQISFFAFVFFLSACEIKSDDQINRKDLQHECIQKLTKVIVHDIYSPPVASRIYAYSNLAFYEGLCLKNPINKSLIEQMKGFDSISSVDLNKGYDFSLVAVVSFFKVATELIFSKDSLSKYEAKILTGFKSQDKSDIYNNSISLGSQLAAIILKRASLDNYRQTRGMPKYNVFGDKGKWEQTPPDYMDAIEPHWPMILPLLLDSASQFRPKSPPKFSLDKLSEYYKELMEVYNLTNQSIPVNDTIAYYWDDNPFVTGHKGHLTFATKKMTPGGHWMAITSILCRKSGIDDLKSARIYALTSASIFDGFISCWEEKYRSSMPRPITVIRENLDPIWEPFLQTPPFPEYTSGHSVISAAASTVLVEYFGGNFSFSDTSEEEYLGLTRSFKSIIEAADEACISRLYGGIHFRSAIEQGKIQGKELGSLYLQLK